jgi:IS30 family transposase
MTLAFTQLSSIEREEISIGLECGDSFAAIGRHLNRPTSTITRERKRCPATYRAHLAHTSMQHAARSRRAGKTKLSQHPQLRTYVLEKLTLRWSPVQIARELCLEYPTDMTMRISHESIYAYIYVLPRGELKQTLIKGLRAEHKYRRTHKRAQETGTETRGKMGDMLSIEERPAEVADRTIPGHWEGDLIIGKYKQSAIGTLVERTTRFTLIVPLPARDARSVRLAFAHAIQTLPETLKKTLTYDQGKEMSQHRQFTAETGVHVYFAHPASPWERGTNENTNGLIRQYFPKGTDFRAIPREEMCRVQNELNGRPRAVLQYRKPIEVFNQLVALNT